MEGVPIPWFYGGPIARSGLWHKLDRLLGGRRVLSVCRSLQTPSSQIPAVGKLIEMTKHPSRSVAVIHREGQKARQSRRTDHHQDRRTKRQSAVSHCRPGQRS
jgi:hypothetical protein